MSQQVTEEVKAGTLAHQDEVGGAVGQVGGGRQAFGAARAGTAHAGRVNGQELPPDCPPLAVALCKETQAHVRGLTCFPLPPSTGLKGLAQQPEAERTHRYQTLRPPGSCRSSPSGAARCDGKLCSWGIAGRK